MRVYFDNAATTPMSQEVIEAMMPYFNDFHGNPSSLHAEGRKTRTAIEQSRKTIAQSLNASIGEIFFTSGGTESNNMALKCAVRDLGVTRIISSPLEHHCVSHTLDYIKKNNGVEIIEIDVCEKGCVNYESLEKLLAESDKKTMVSLMHANNEIGTLLDLERVSAMCDEHGAYLHSDTVQTIGHFPIDVSKTKIHFLSAGAHKFHGPKGVGFIYINGDSMLKPMIDGGSQERNMRGGTENLYGIVGMAKALELATEQMEERKNHISDVRSYLKEKLIENFDNIIFNGCQENPLYTVLSASFPPSEKSEMLLMLLDIKGISVSGGSACSSGAEQGSHVIAGIGRSAEYKTIRFSFSHYNTKEECDFVIEKLAEIIPSKKEAVINDR